MKKMFSIGPGLIVSCALLSAAPPTCINGTLASYIALGAQGCTLNGVNFANFSYAASATGGAATIRADEIMVTPMLIVPEAMRLTFAAPWSVGRSQGQDSVIRYTAVLPCGSTQTTQADLTLGVAHVGGLVGSAKVVETTNTGNLTVFAQCVEVCQTKSSDTHKFNPVGVVIITDHVSLSGGDGGASLNEYGAGLNLCIPCV